MAKNKEKLTTPQIRVLQVLYQTRGVLTKVKIAERMGAQAPITAGRAIGYSSDEKRERFKKTIDGKNTGTPLIDRGYVVKKVLDVDGHRESGYEITEKGIEAYKALGVVKLPPLKDTWAKTQGRSDSSDVDELDKLFDGKIYAMLEGEDFTSSPIVFRTKLHNRAKKLGFTIQTSISKNSGPKTITFQVVKE